MTEYAIFPCPAPRMTRRDKWLNPPRPCVQRYWNFRDRVKHFKVEVPVGASITFYMPTPSSWSKKKCLEMQGQPHTIKPDLDNLIKGLLDAALKEDCHIWKLGTVQKIWRDRPGIEIVPPTNKQTREEKVS